MQQRGLLWHDKQGRVHAGPAGNDIHKTNVPDIRLRFRQDAYVEEMSVVVGGAHGYAQKQKAKLEKEMREQAHHG